MRCRWTAGMLTGVLAGLGTVLAQGTATPPPQTTTPPPAQTAAPPRPTPPTRDPNSPGFVPKKELPDGTVAPPDQDGNFIVGPTHPPAPEMTAPEGGLQGTVYNFTMSSADSKIYPGIARDQGPSVHPIPPIRQSSW